MVEVDERIQKVSAKVQAIHDELGKQFLKSLAERMAKEFQEGDTLAVPGLYEAKVTWHIHYKDGDRNNQATPWQSIRLEGNLVADPLREKELPKEAEPSKKDTAAPGMSGLAI